MSDAAFEVVYEAASELEANYCTALLKDQGIEVQVVPAGEAWERIYFGAAAGPAARLLAPADQAARARELLEMYRRQLESGAFMVDEEDNQSS